MFFIIFNEACNMLIVALLCVLSRSPDMVSWLLQQSIKPWLAHPCRLFSLCWCTCKGKIRALMITTCRHSDISLDTQQWAVGHSPAERKRNHNSMSSKKGKQVIIHLKAHFTLVVKVMIFHNKAINHSKQIIQLNLKE